MQTRDKEKQSGEGNSRVDKLRTRLADLVDGFRTEMGNNKASTHIFKPNNKWYKVSLKIGQTDADIA
jgi:hypothetical protein